MSNIYLKVTIRKQKIPRTVLKRRSLRFSWYKNRKSKVKLWWVGAHERKMTAFFVPFILHGENFFKICVISDCIVYWIHFFRIYILLCVKKHHTLFLLVFKIVEAFSVSLRELINFFFPWNHQNDEQKLIKGTLMQIWKSPYMFLLI